MFNTQQDMIDEFQQTPVQLNKGQFRQQTLRQYYRYLNLLKKTNNFCKDLNVYKNIHQHDFEDLALIGWIFQVETIKIKLEDGKEQQCMVPVVYSNIKDPFKNYQEIGNKTSLNNPQTIKRIVPEKAQNDSKHILEPHVKRSLLLLKNNYTKYFLKAFNQILKQSKQFRKHFVMNSKEVPNPNYVAQIQWVYAFTGLRIAFQNNKLYFVMTQKTKLIAIDIKFYIQIIQNLQKSVGFPYSYVSLPNTPLNYHQQSVDEGYSFHTLQSQSSLIDKISFTGILKQFAIEQPKTTDNKKDRQIVLTFLQDGIVPNKKMLGLAKVIIKFSWQQNQEQLHDFFKVGFIYLITNVELNISSTINICYKLKRRWQEHIFELNIQKSPQLSSSIIQQLKTIEFSWLRLANANRNIIKAEVDYIRCQHLYGKVVCTQCKQPLTSDQFCSKYCGKNEGQLNLWAIVLVTDRTGYAELSLQTKQTRQFFQFIQEDIQQMKRFVIAQNSRKMFKIFSQYNYYSARSSSDTIYNFQRILIAKYNKRTLIAIPKHNVNQSYIQQLTQQEKLQFQQSLQTTKEFMKKNKVFFNGYFKKIDKTLRQACPNLKVIEILNS